MTKTRPVPNQTADAEIGTPPPIVVGLDDSEEGRDALELARVLGEVRGARCLVANVIEWGPTSVRRWIGGAEESEVVPLFDAARKTLSGLEVETHIVGSRSPGRTLAELAAREGASTLVIGAPHHRTSAGRALLGSVAERLLHHAPCEVAIAPRGYGDTSLSHAGLDQVAVAFDGTTESRHALRHAEDLAAAAGATIQILVAKDPLVAGIEAEAPSPQGSGHAVLDGAIGSVRESLQARGEVLRPEPRETVTTIAAALAGACEGDILVCGSRPARDRILLASVTKRVIEMSVHPVLVVPATPGE